MQPQQMTKLQNPKIPHAAESAEVGSPQIDPDEEKSMFRSRGIQEPNKQKQKLHRIFKDASLHPVSIQRAHYSSIEARTIFSFDFTLLHRESKVSSSYSLCI